MTASSFAQPKLMTSIGKRLSGLACPTVLINNQASTESNYSVYHNDFDGSRTMTNHLLALGHKRIAYLGNGHAGLTNEERKRGYVEALSAQGIALEDALIVAAPDGSPSGAASAASALLMPEQRPTAIVCFNDIMAVGAIHTLNAAGLRVPQDVSVTGFDDVLLSAFVTPPITTFRQPKYELGRESAEMILDLIGEPDSIGRKLLRLHGEIVIRNSTAKPA